MKLNEKELTKITKPYFEKCRAGDWNHALRVVKWVKILGKGRKDLNLIITAAYLHDIGWSNVLKEGKVDFDQMLEYESKANENTPIFVKKVLERLKFKNEDLKTVIRLINAADQHLAQLDDEEIIVDADNLSKLCPEHVKEKYKKNSYKKVIDLWEREFPNRIKTKIGKEKYLKLLEKLKKDL